MNPVNSIKTAITCLFFALIIPITAFAQGEGIEQKMKEIDRQKVTQITSYLSLSTDEAQSFWDLYNEYTAAKKSIKAKYKAGGSSLNKDQEELDLKKTYYDKFAEILEGDKAEMVFEAEKAFKKELLQLLKDLKSNRP